MVLGPLIYFALEPVAHVPFHRAMDRALLISAVAALGLFWLRIPLACTLAMESRGHHATASRLLHRRRLDPGDARLQPRAGRGSPAPILDAGRAWGRCAPGPRRRAHHTAAGGDGFPGLRPARAHRRAGPARRASSWPRRSSCWPIFSKSPRRSMASPSISGVAFTALGAAFANFGTALAQPENAGKAANLFLIGLILGGIYLRNGALWCQRGSAQRLDLRPAPFHRLHPARRPALRGRLRRRYPFQFRHDRGTTAARNLDMAILPASLRRAGAHTWDLAADWVDCALGIAFPWPDSAEAPPVRIEAPLLPPMRLSLSARWPPAPPAPNCNDCVNRTWHFDWARSGYRTGGQVLESIVGLQVSRPILSPGPVGRMADRDLRPTRRRSSLGRVGSRSSLSPAPSRTWIQPGLGNGSWAGGNSKSGCIELPLSLSRDRFPGQARSRCSLGEYGRRLPDETWGLT